MSLALSIAIHKSLIAGLPLGDESILAPYGGCWVPHAHILGIDSAWVLSSDSDYDCHTFPDNLCVDLITWTPDGYGWVYCSDGETHSCFRIQRKEQ